MTVEVDPSYVWPKVEIREVDECWPWLGGRNKRGGHGVAYIGNQRSMSAHRAVYQIVNGPVPDGLVLDHLCRNPGCVNPKHVEPVTQAVNVQRGRVAEVSRAIAAAITHCPQGHPYDEPNTLYGTNHRKGSRFRRCRLCTNAANRRSRARRKTHFDNIEITT